MSFKRDEDDGRSLGLLRQRRVQDLLCEEVPDDEVMRLSNGRLTCLVCHHRPIFDTLNMLVVHRKGKKHEANALYQEQQKIEVERLIEKRKQEQYLTTGSYNTQQLPAPVTTTKSLGERTPYDPRVKKSRPKPYERKSRLDIHDPVEDSLKYSTETSDVSQLPDNRTIGQQSVTNKADSASQVIGIKKERITVSFNKTKVPSVEPEKITKRPSHQTNSFTSRHIKPKNTDDSVLHRQNISKFIDPTNNDLRVKHYIERRRLKDEVRANVSNALHPTLSAQPEPTGHTSWKDFKFTSRPSSSIHRDKGTKSANIKDCLSDSVTTQPVSTTKIEKQSHTLPSLSTEKQSQVLPSLSTEKQSQVLPSISTERAEKLLQLRSAGWKRDWDGKWVKDEDAEFDSDEEVPDIT